MHNLFILALLVPLTCFPTVALVAQDTPAPLTDGERTILSQIEMVEFDKRQFFSQKARIVGLRSERTGVLGVLSNLSAFDNTAASKPKVVMEVRYPPSVLTPVPGDPSRRAVIGRYYYDRGAVARVFVDLTNKHVVARDVEFNAPVPLTDDEIQSALQIARSGDKNLGEALRSISDKNIAIFAQPIIDNNEKSARYAHRLTEITVVAMPAFLGVGGDERTLGRYFVDLSMGELVEHRH